MKLVKQYFTIWWTPLLVYFIPIAIFVIATLIKKDIIVDVSLVLFFLNIIGNLIAAIVQIALKKWYFIFQLIVSALLLFCVSMLFLYSPPDYYGANKVIPHNISVNIPVDKEILENDLGINDFALASISQPGIYNYYTTYHPKVTGAFYIKAYEVTSNDRLSETRINERSKIIVRDLDEKMYSGEFTIYEGSWGDKYAAKIELWFKPTDGSSEYKLSEKNYLVEGWMR